MTDYTVNGHKVPASSMEEAIALEASLFGAKTGPPPPTPVPKEKPQGTFGGSFLDQLSNTPAAIGSWLKSTVVDPVVRAGTKADQAFSAGNYPQAIASTIEQAVPGLATADDYIRSKMESAKKFYSGEGPVTDVFPGGEAGRHMTDNFLQNIATKGRPEAYGRLASDALVQMALGKAPEVVPPALAAIKNNAGTLKNAAGAGLGTYAIYKGLEGASPAVRAATEVALAAGGLKYGKGAIIRELAKLTKGEEPVVSRPTGLPDVTGSPTGLPNKPISGVMPPEPIAVPEPPPVEVPATGMADLVKQALPPKPKFSHEAARDAAIELFNRGISKKDAPGLLKQTFEDSHPDVINTIIKEEYKRLIDKATGKPVQPETSTSPAATPASPPAQSPPPPETVAPEVMPPAVSGRRWQQENLSPEMTPEAKAAAIDAQTAQNFSGVRGNQMNAGAGDNARAWIQKYEASTPEARKVMISGLSGKLNYEDMRQLASYNEDITTNNPAPPPLSYSQSTGVPPAISALKTQTEFMSRANAEVSNAAKMVKDGIKTRDQALQLVIKNTGASPDLAFRWLTKALNGG